MNEIKIDGMTWFVQRIDSTHLTMSTDKEKLNGPFTIWHIAELKGHEHEEEFKRILKKELAIK